MLPKPRSKFDLFFLCGGILLALAIPLGPLVRDWLAHYTWTEVPCHRFITNGAPSDRYVFTWNGRSYAAARRNMWWQRMRDAARTTPGYVMPEINDHCFVNGDDPPLSVYRLDTWQHLGDGLGYFIGSGLVFIVVVVLYLKFTKGNKALPDSAV